MILAFDGTLDGDKPGAACYTNVVLLAELLAKKGLNVCYLPGVGTRGGVAGRILGGAFGLGEKSRINEAYQAVCHNWANGDTTIYMVGFSRGAATCLDMANYLAKYGIVDPKTQKQVAGNPKIHAIFLFDTVGSFGVASLFGDKPQLNFGHKLRLPPAIVDYCFHAIAADENRYFFGVIRVEGEEAVIFRGVHTDIGGGQTTRNTLSDITMRWMLFKAKAIGLPITMDDINTFKVDPAAVPNLHPIYGAWPFIWRTFNYDDWKHYTVTPFPNSNPLANLTKLENQTSEALATPIPSEVKAALPGVKA